MYPHNAIWIHNSDTLTEQRPRPNAYVDFFFLLSGFVLTYTYQEKLDRGLGTVAFLRERIIRLYPLYFLGLVLGLSLMFARSHFGRLNVSATELIMMAVLGLLFLPYGSALRLAGTEAAFPLDYAAWSLFVELTMNILHTVALRRRSTRFLCIVVVCAALCVMYLSYTHAGLDFGSSQADVLLAIPRVIFSYVLGMILCRAWQYRNLRWKLPVWVPVLAVMAVLLTPRVHHNAILDCFLIMLVWPPVLLVAASVEPKSQFGLRLAELAGGISYAVYVLHLPIRGFFEQGWPQVARHIRHLDAPVSGVVLMIAVCGIGYAADRFYDLPIRKAIKGWIRARSGPEALVPAAEIPIPVPERLTSSL